MSKLSQVTQYTLLMQISIFSASGPVQAQPEFAYVANSRSDTISGYSIDPTLGILAPLGQTPLPNPSYHSPAALVVDISHQFLYALIENPGCFLRPCRTAILEYQIDRNLGGLTYLGEVNGPDGASAMTLAQTPVGNQFVYVAATQYAVAPAYSSVSAYEVGADGTLTDLQLGSALAEPPIALAATVTPSNQPLLYVASVGPSPNLFAFKILDSGGLQRWGTGSQYPADWFTFSVATHPSGDFIYACNINYIANWGGFDEVGSISAYRRDRTTGELKELPGSPIPTQYGYCNLAIDPTGRFLFVTHNGNINGPPADDGSISEFIIDPYTGGLTLSPGFPLATGREPFAVAVHPTLNVLYVTFFEEYLQQTGTVTAYQFDVNTGALSPLNSQPVGWTPKGIAVDPSGRYAYVTNDGFVTQLPSSLNGFQLDANTGALVGAVPGSPYPSRPNPRYPKVAPSGQWLFVPIDNVQDEINTSVVAGYRINAGDGSLIEMPQSPFTTGPSPDSIAVTPGGDCAFVTSDASDAIWEYRVNPETGVWAALDDTPITNQGQPISIALDPTGGFAYVANFDTFPDGPPWGTVSAYQIDVPNCKLHEVAPAPAAGSKPASMVADATGRFLYIADRGGYGLGNLFAYQIGDPREATTLVQVIPQQDYAPLLVSVHPSQPFAYVVFDGYPIGSAQGYRIAPNGTLAPVGQPVDVETTPSSSAVDASGGFFYVTNSDSNSVSQCIIGTDGSLSPNPISASVPTGESPESIGGT